MGLHVCESKGVALSPNNVCHYENTRVCVCVCVATPLLILFCCCSYMFDNSIYWRVPWTHLINCDNQFCTQLMFDFSASAHKYKYVIIDAYKNKWQFGIGVSIYFLAIVAVLYKKVFAVEEINCELSVIFPRMRFFKTITALLFLKKLIANSRSFFVV